MSDFDLSKITGKEGPLPTDEDLRGLCADVMKAEIARLKAALDRIADTTGIAGVDRPIDVEECVRSLVQFRAEDNEKAQAEIARLKAALELAETRLKEASDAN